MSSQRNDDRRLATLERWRILELDEAKSERATLDETVHVERAVVNELTQQIENTREAARAIVTQTQPFSAGALREANDYAAWQTGALSQKMQALQKTEKLAEAARTVVVEKFKNLTVLEKLRERRKRENAVEATRRDQKLLDDRAIMVLGEKIVRPTSFNRNS